MTVWWTRLAPAVHPTPFLKGRSGVPEPVEAQGGRADRHRDPGAGELAHLVEDGCGRGAEDSDRRGCVVDVLVGRADVVLDHAHVVAEVLGVGVDLDGGGLGAVLAGV